MLLIVLTTILILAIAFYQAVQGMLSAIIMAILSVLSAVVALTYYEPLADMLVGRLGAYAHGMVLVALFALPLLAMREVFDRVIRGNVVMGAWTDRIGGGAFGLIAGMVMGGVLMISLQLLPLPGSALTYRPYTASLEEGHGMAPRWAGRFVLGIAKHLSAGSFRPIGEESEAFGEAHDDLLLEAFCVRNRPPGSRASTPQDAMRVREAYRLQISDEKKLADEMGLTPGQIAARKAEMARISDAVPLYPLGSQLREDQPDVYVVRVVIDELARNEDGLYCLPATHFRLVTESHSSFYPVGYLTFCGRLRLETKVSEDDKAQITDIVVTRPWSKDRGPKALTVDWVYRLPEGERPDRIIFRRVAEARVMSIIEALPSKTDEKQRFVALTVKPVYGSSDFPQVSGRAIRPKRVVMKNLLPSAVTIRVRKTAEALPILAGATVSGRTIEKGTIHAPSAELQVQGLPGKSARVHSELGVPGSGFNVVQVECEVNGAAMLPGAMRPRLILDNGQLLSHAGAYMAYTGAQGRQLYIYHDPTGRDALEPAFANALKSSLGTVTNLTFLFVTPPDKADDPRSIAAFTFLAGPADEHYALRPLSLTKRRR